MVHRAHMGQSRKRHLDQFNRFGTVCQCDQHTDTQTTLRVISIAIGFICALHAGDAA